MAAITKRRLRNGGTSWDVAVRISGHPPVCKTFHTKAAAKLWANGIESAASKRTLIHDGKTRLSTLLENHSANLKSPSAAALKYWDRELGTLRLRDITAQMISEHRDRLLGAPCRSHMAKRSKPRSAATVVRYLATLSQVFAIATKDLFLSDHNPVDAVRKPSVNNGRTRFLKPEQRNALLTACQKSESPDLHLAVWLSLATGLRRGELRKLTWRNLNLDQRWAILPKTKNGSSRGIPLLPEIAQALQERRDAVNPLEPDEPIFTHDLTKAFQTALRRAGISDFRWHDLRHDCGSLLVQRGASLSEVAKLLGHRDIRMTHRYSHIGDEHTQALVERVWANQ